MFFYYSPFVSFRPFGPLCDLLPSLFFPMFLQMILSFSSSFFLSFPFSMFCYVFQVISSFPLLRLFFFFSLFSSFSSSPLPLLLFFSLSSLFISFHFFLHFLTRFPFFCFLLPVACLVSCALLPGRWCICLAQYCLIENFAERGTSPPTRLFIPSLVFGAAVQRKSLSRVDSDNGVCSFPAEPGNRAAGKKHQDR